ncbi:MULTISPECIES: Scr1 family TA system antitoxin-like transcriptional regulator [unclassified Nocardiopsis]|uniref:Scr1 family TA system antitoxin-like transcriptional regulator n=1 Tax=unclassified Nocardiopsis TaxID=2649073 RepID=UPI001F2CECD1|nr:MULTISPECIES: Scr1 family TA system antitoxin-like transcriptional regulator [unclassified Nocardiopsis]
MSADENLARALAELHRNSTDEELRTVYELGATIARLATATGRSGGWVVRRLRRADTRMRPRGWQSRPRTAPTSMPAAQPGADAPVGPSSTVLRHRLIRRLVELRTQAGLTQAQAARAVDVSCHTLLRAEHPEGPVTLDLLRALCALYDAPPPVREDLVQLWRDSRAPEWWTLQNLRVPGGRRTELGLRADARRVYGWADALVPDLVQTTGYARAIERLVHDSEEPVEMAVSVRMAAQRRVRRRGIDQRYVVDEAVIRRRVGGTQVMVDQLAVLRALAERGRVRVLSHASGHCASEGPFELCWIPGLDDTALSFPRSGKVHIGDPPPPTYPLRFFREALAQAWEWAEDTDTTLAMLDDSRARLLATDPALTPTTTTR